MMVDEITFPGEKAYEGVEKSRFDFVYHKGPYKRRKTKPQSNEQTLRRRVFGENEDGVRTNAGPA